MRKNYIDNLRRICVLLLFVYHTFMVYNSFGESFYVKGADVQATTNFIMAVWPWFMPLLFLLAGVSSAYALQKRSAKEYIKERVFKLFIPLLFGILLLVPAQTYFAEVFHNGYTGNYFAQYILFFTKPTDLSGYHGGFTPAHLWFILYLFIISMAALPIMQRYQKSSKKIPAHKITLPVLLLLFLIPGVCQAILDIAGKSVGEYMAWFLLGYFFISEDAVQEKLEKHRFLLLVFAIALMAFMLIGASRWETFENDHPILYEVVYFLYAWVVMLAILGLGKRYLEFSNRATAYLTKSSFGVYILHQQWVVIAAYFTLLWIGNIPLQMVCIILASAAFTFLTYEAFRRVSVTRFLFGLKK